MAKKQKVQKTKVSQGIFLKTNIGQHVLKNPAIIENIVNKANIFSSDIVLEIGPGTGNLTAKLLEKAMQVVVIEVDMRMIAELEKRFRTSPFYSKLKIIAGDALKVDLPFFTVCVANLPYQISSPFIFRLLAHRPLYRHCILMLQREFANRLVARPGEKCFCRLSVNAQMLARVDHLLKVGRNNFKPPPRVDSSFVRLEPRNPPFNVDYAEWDGLTRACFVRKNKTLNAAFSSKALLQVLTSTYHSNKHNDSDVNVQTIIKSVLAQHAFDEKRPRTMSIQEFMMLLKSFNDAGIHFSSFKTELDEDEE